MSDPITIDIHATGNMMKPPYITITPDLARQIVRLAYAHDADCGQGLNESCDCTSSKLPDPAAKPQPVADDAAVDAIKNIDPIIQRNLARKILADIRARKIPGVYWSDDYLNDKQIEIYNEQIAALRAQVERKRAEVIAVEDRLFAREAERDNLRRDLCEIAEGCGVGVSDQAEAKRRIIAIRTERDTARAELAAEREKREKAERFEAVCHCGSKVSSHTAGDGHMAVEMEDRCHFEQERDTARERCAELEGLLSDVLVYVMHEKRLGSASAQEDARRILAALGKDGGK